MAEPLDLPPPPPLRQLDVATLEGLDDLVDAEGPDRALVKSRDFPELIGQEVQPQDIKVVLYDANSVDSFAACYAARRALGDGAYYVGVDRGMAVEDLDIDIGGQVVAMLGVCWSIDSLHELISECDWLFILETHLSAVRELEQFTYPSALRILDCELSAAVLSWNFFFPGDPVPPLYRALEDAELGRQALRGSAAFADGFQAAFNLQLPRGLVQYTDKSFQDLEEALDEENGGRSSLDVAAAAGRNLAEAIRGQCLEAESGRSVRTLRAFPAWRCSLANVSTPFAGRVAEHLAGALVAEGGDLALERSLAAVFQVWGTRVRVALRSLPGGPDVSEIAQDYNGCGRPTRAFFSVHFDEWEDLWVQPEPVLWDTHALGRCLALKRGEKVTIAHRGERFKESPCDQWSWGYRTEDHSAEGWIPTLAHTLHVAVRAAPNEGPGIYGVEEGDLLVARGQKGKYLWGTNHLAADTSSSPLKGWFPHPEGLWQPVHPSSALELVEGGMLA